jgi:Undecaprenyl-phosphate galactose phosphotransferase WbaP
MSDENHNKIRFDSVIRRTKDFSVLKPILLLIAGDLLSIIICFAISSLVIRSFYYPALNIFNLYLEFQLVMPVFFVMFTINRLYPGYGNFIVNEIRSIWITITLMFSLMAVASLFVHLQIWYVKSFFFLSWALLLFIMPIMRHIIKMLFTSKPWWGTPVLIIGSAKSTKKAIESLQKNPFGGYKPVACFIDDYNDESIEIESVEIFSLDELHQFDSIDSIETVIFINEGIPENRKHDAINHCVKTFKDTIIVNEIYGLSSFWLLFNSSNSFYGVKLRSNLLDKPIIIYKRLFDLIMSVVLLVVWLPIMIYVTLSLMLSGTRKVFYKQVRMGLKGKHFNLFKFRTMNDDAHDSLSEILDKYPEKKEEYAKFHKLKDDPRITNLGRTLRKFSLDELPQFINVLKGDMSLIGPRAYLPEERTKMNDTDKLILNVKPGVTGLWQVTERNDSTFEERCMADIYYIRNWTLSLDFYIFIKTIWVVVTGKSSF